MTHSVEDILIRWAAKGAQGSYKFIIRGASTWRLEQNAVSKGDGPAAVTIELSEAVFQEIATHRCTPQEAYVRGDLKVSGDVGLSLKLSYLVG